MFELGHVRGAGAAATGRTTRAQASTQATRHSHTAESRHDDERTPPVTRPSRSSHTRRRPRECRTRIATTGGRRPRSGTWHELDDLSDRHKGNCLHAHARGCASRPGPRRLPRRRVVKVDAAGDRVHRLNPAVWQRHRLRRRRRWRWGTTRHVDGALHTDDGHLGRRRRLARRVLDAQRGKDGSGQHADQQSNAEPTACAQPAAGRWR